MMTMSRVIVQIIFFMMMMGVISQYCKRSLWSQGDDGNDYDEDDAENLDALKEGIKNSVTESLCDYVEADEYDALYDLVIQDDQVRAWIPEGEQV